MNSFSSARLARTLSAPLLALACLPALAATDPAQMELGKKLFATSVPACAICHTLKDAGAEGAVGPVLDELKPNSARVSKALRDGIGSMPSFKATLSEAQIAALAHYVSRASGGEK
ncbi:sulfite dehydrogenase (cytochrome) subunit SorB [Polaromonas sp. OV174]|uniref:SorU family sulfite dehydrogenase c-type cytochrome subunit n=1 Tax=Polaromonas sp. OV174 TaxID=1855300 RepID=UPI0008F2AA2D|nr:cytochrome c [Polaromonas sp. OV174]SFC49654.1 sulfite dehydrogenase (cytochrome) subunit SorB [Polaromonas sp. OV174]